MSFLLCFCCGCNIYKSNLKKAFLLSVKIMTLRFFTFFLSTKQFHIFLAPKGTVLHFPILTPTHWTLHNTYTILVNVSFFHIFVDIVKADGMRRCGTRRTRVERRTCRRRHHHHRVRRHQRSNPPLTNQNSPTMQRQIQIRTPLALSPLTSAVAHKLQISNQKSCMVRVAHKLPMWPTPWEITLLIFNHKFRRVPATHKMPTFRGSSWKVVGMLQCQ